MPEFQTRIESTVPTASTYDAFLMDHAAGTLQPALSVAADLHVALDARGARLATFWEITGGVLFESVGEEDAVIRSTGTRTNSGRRPGRARHILSHDLNDISWRRGLSGVKFAPSGVRGGQFMMLEPGKSAPHHGHTALEATVVLEGQLDVDGHVHQRGDIVFGAPGDRHKPLGYGDEPCICYVGREKRPIWRLS